MSIILTLGNLQYPIYPKEKADIMQEIVNTPEPPYYAVIAPAVLSDDISGYFEMALKIMDLANDVEGFLGIESSFQDRFVLSITYWTSLEAIDAWKNNSHHMIAKNTAKQRWFDRFFTRIAKVERDY